MTTMKSILSRLTQAVSGLLGLCRVHGDSQRNPSGVYMEFVAQLVECQVVALVVMGSIPIKLPNASIAQW